MRVSDSFTQDLEPGFWMAVRRMSRMRICFSFSEADADAEVEGKDGGGVTVGMHSTGTK